MVNRDAHSPLLVIAHTLVLFVIYCPLLLLLMLKQPLHWLITIAITVNSQYNSQYAMGKGTQIFTHYSTSPSYVETHHYEDPNQILPLTTLKQSCISYGANTLNAHHHQQQQLLPSYTTSNSYSTLNDHSSVSSNANGNNNATGSFHHTLIGLNSSSHLNHQLQAQQQQQNVFPCDFTNLRDISTLSNRTTLSRRTDLWQLEWAV